MTKNIKLILKIIILILGFYLGHKFYYLYKYQVSNKTIPSYTEFIKLLSNTHTVTIEVKNKENVNYLELNNIKIRNDQELDLKLVENETYSKKYETYDENGDILYAIWISGPEENFIEEFINDSKQASGGIYKKYYEENNVYDLISLIKYLAKNTDKKANIFTSTREIEWLYTMNALVGSIFENAEDLFFIEGTYQGIMFTYKSSNQKSILINKDGKNYGINFIGLDYFTDEYINELLETLIIE